MSRIVFKVVKQAISTECVNVAYIKTDIVERISDGIEHENEAMRKMFIDAVSQIVGILGCTDISEQFLFVHRQTACAVIKHAALDVSGLGCEDCSIPLARWATLLAHLQQRVHWRFRRIDCFLSPRP